MVTTWLLLLFFFLFYHYLYNPEHVVQIVIHVLIPEPDYFYSVAHHLSLFQSIFASHVTEAVRISIQFDTQADGWTKEIKNVRSNRFLSVKIDAAHLSSLEVLPQYDFTSGAIVSKPPGFLF